MRKILFCLAVLLGSIGCNKTKTDVEEIKELTAQFSFVVKDLRLSADSPGYMLQAGDKITMEVKGDEDTFVSIEGLFFNPQNGAPRVAREQKQLKEWQGRQVIDPVFH